MNSVYIGCGELDISAGKVHLALDFERDANACQLARRFEDLYCSIVHELRSRHGAQSIEGLPATAFADLCARIAVAIRALPSGGQRS